MKYADIAKINVNEHTEKKNGLTYLSWAWAVDQLMRLDENASWHYAEPRNFGETMMVACTVRAFGRERTAQLPVMDYKNKTIPNPDAFAVNTAMQRCLAKAIALHGLGLYIYAGEDVPEEGGGQQLESSKSIPRADYDSLQNDTRKRVDEMEAEMRRMAKAEGWSEAYKMLKAKQADGTFDATEISAVWSKFDSKERSAMKNGAKA